MGRATQSQGLAPPVVRKGIRAKQARHIVNKVVPAILASNARARRGAEGSELIIDPGPVTHASVGQDGAREPAEVAYVKRKGQGRRKAKGEGSFLDEVAAREDVKPNKGKKRKPSPDQQIAALAVSSNPPPTPLNPPMKIRIIATDTLTAAHLLTFPPNPLKKQPNTAILNMASPLRPGGGTLLGATSQEEFLCARTTLLASLHEPYYRLPEYGGIFTRDVLVLRDASGLGSGRGGWLKRGERWWVDVVSAGMVRVGDLEGGKWGEREREVVGRKMRGVMRILVARGVRRVVLGAWGCGAYGNLAGDVAGAWRGGLGGGGEERQKSKREKRDRGRAEEVERWEGIEEVVFAISNRRMAGEFAEVFGGVEVEEGPGKEREEEEEEEDEVAEELRSKIGEMEAQIQQMWNPESKARIGVILEKLREQLAERVGELGEDDDSGGIYSEDEIEAWIGGDTEKEDEIEDENASENKSSSGLEDDDGSGDTK
ncbi:hypothetical protein EJ04DRAFT_493452 [Polyplosphaeria fusca]|uniref:Microbial-type PARG catalytic domain-containing protein n=1 Tax=Polyplosphaeria fusca TaxID=682080 RepID=A0A9P4QV85_9PLEO|nr:hypothetical protein EJ04DRAFT_493452 [Polyplosphaeria fusca]